MIGTFGPVEAFRGGKDGLLIVVHIAQGGGQAGMSQEQYEVARELSELD